MNTVWDVFKSWFRKKKQSRKRSCGEENIDFSKVFDEKSSKEVVKRQHYVWRKYLSSWTNTKSKDGCIYVCRRNYPRKKAFISESNLEGVGFANYYYDISGFNKKDFDTLNRYFDYFQREKKFKLFLPWNLFKDYGQRKDFIEKSVMCAIEALENDNYYYEKLISGDVDFYKKSNVLNAYNAVKRGWYEALYGGQTVDWDEINRLTVEAFHEDRDEQLDFNRFLIMQYVRSKAVQERIRKSFLEFAEKSGEVSQENVPFYSVLFSLFFAETLAFNISQNYNCSLKLLVNNTATPFITGDTPIYVIVRNEAEGECDFYYPIAPDRAVMLGGRPHKFDLSDADEQNNKVVECTEDKEIEVLNDMLASECLHEIYSNSREALERYCVDDRGKI